MSAGNKSSPKVLKNVLWLGIAAIALALLVWHIGKDREVLAAFTQALRALQPRWAAAGLMIYVGSQALLALRWLLLLRLYGLTVRPWPVVQLTFLGLFYNNLMPGAVGGDILKAWHIAKHSAPGQKLEVAFTVFVDRLIGLIGLIFIAFGASFFFLNALTTDGDTAGMLHRLQHAIWVVTAMTAALLVLGLTGAADAIFRWRVFARFEKLSSALARVHQAVVLYRRCRGTLIASLLLAIFIQSLAITAVWFLARGLALDISLAHCLVIMPTVWVIGAVIPVPGGLGIMENGITFLFALALNPQDMDQAVGQAAALALAIRLMICLCSLPGGIVPVFCQVAQGPAPPHDRLSESAVSDESQIKQ